MDSIQPIAAVVATAGMAPVGASAPVSMLSPTSAAGPSMEETQRFRAIMDAPEPVSEAPAGPQQSLLTHMMANGEEFLRHTHEKVAELRAQSPYMTPSEFVAASIEVSNAASIGAFRLQAATSITSGTNKSIQTLLKNS